MKKIEEIGGFKKRNKRALWIFKLDKQFEIVTYIKNYEFSAKWLEIEKKGKIKIPKGYAWDGCTFKKSVLDIFIIGTPDGIIDIDTMKPKTYYASLVHDALYQYYGYHGISRKAIDKLFLDMMKKTKFKLSLLYYTVVRIAGWLFYINKRIKKYGDKYYAKDYYEKIRKNS